MGAVGYIEQLRAKPCECVSCGTCDGFGSIDDPLDYSGTYPRTCEDCDGSGMTEVCGRCMELEEIERNDF
jgi:DnaJ-class molecular chaperone